MADGLGPASGSEWFRKTSGRHHVARQGEARREKFLDVLAETGDKAEALAAAGVTNETYLKWRQRHEGFAARADAAKGMPREDLTDEWKSGFADFRRTFFDMDSPWFHLDMIEAIEATEPGELTMILLPPEHGKTTLLEDYCSYKLATDPTTRIMIGSGKQAHSKKVLGRIRRRMEPQGPARRYVAKWGPFMPQPGGEGRAHSQPWGETHFDVWKKAGGAGGDERDYSMVALGIGGEVQGTRTDWLIIDDVQSLKTLSQTDKIVDYIRQDWLSRPGAKGRTCIIGTRVGDFDVYEELLKAEMIDHLVLYPAINHRGDYLWPERYSPEEYARMRRNVGPSAWARNYQQAPLTDGAGTFTTEDIEPCINPFRSVMHDCPAEVSECIISIDPGYGVNATLVAGITPQRMLVLALRTDEGLRRTEDIFGIAEEYCHQYPRVGVITIEDKAFQKGLQEDTALLTMQRRFGFRITGHQTGINKIDEDIGIPAMARSFRRQEIELPGAPDHATEAQTKALISELLRWKPGVRGNKLRQDLVMALWFAWLIWRDQRNYGHIDTQTFRFQGLPWTPTRSGLTVPRTGVLAR